MAEQEVIGEFFISYNSNGPWRRVINYRCLHCPHLGHKGRCNHAVGNGFNCCCNAISEKGQELGEIIYG